MSRIATAVVGARFLSALPSFLRTPVDARAARAIQARRRRERESTFLAMVRGAVYEQPRSPYRRLLDSVGCELGDLERAVEEEGVEGALRALYRQGVYLTVAEFKGRSPIRRGSTSIESGPDLLRNPLAAFHFQVRSGGSRSSGTPVLIDLAFVRACAVSTRILLDAWGDSDWRKAVWETPGAGARFRLLKYTAAAGRPPSRWFSQVDPKTPGLDPMFRWGERAIRWGSRLTRVRMPRPELAPVDNPQPVARWMSDVRRHGATPYLFTFPSSAVRLCQVALEQGIDISGAQLLIGGEPITKARLAVLRGAGVRAVPRYGSMECGPVGYGCLNPTAPDDVHVLDDMHALIQPPASSPNGLPSDALLATSLQPKAPFVLLNASMGDQAAIHSRACDCPLEGLGYGTHLHTIRSFEKLTGEGLTFVGADVIAVLEENLPARFGGAPGDYQLIEDERDDGRPRLRLLAHPRIGELDDAALADAFLAGVGAGSGNQLMERIWRDSGLLEVERRAPEPTRAGKLLHLRVGRD